MPPTVEEDKALSYHERCFMPQCTLPLGGREAPATRPHRHVKGGQIWCPYTEYAGDGDGFQNGARPVSIKEFVDKAAYLIWQGKGMGE